MVWDPLLPLPEALVAKLKPFCKMLRDAGAPRGADSKDVLLAIPKGLLLYGPPRSGKVAIARLIANEAGLAFLAAGLADVKADLVGQSGFRVHDLFQRARAMAPCILFIRDLDTFAPIRGSSKTNSASREI